MYQVNVPALKGKIVERGYTNTSISKKIGVSRETFRNYLNHPGRLPIEIIYKLISTLNLSNSEASAIFFNL